MFKTTKVAAQIILPAFLIIGMPVFAQEVTASLTGRVTDASGAIIPRARVLAVNNSTNLRSETETNNSGDYFISFLRPGEYKISISQAGFKSYERSGITLEVNQRARLDVVLDVGQITEKVEVTAAAPPINTENAIVGKVIDHTSISVMPLNGRLNITGLLALAPGIQNAGNQDGIPTNGVAPTVAGAYSGRSVGFTLDGVSNTMSWLERGQGEFPPLDGIQEFKVISSGATAEFDKAYQVIVVTKGGSNDLHGMLVYTNRNRLLAARNFFSTSPQKPKYNRNEAGGNISGPVYIPHLYNGRNKTFFAFNAEGFWRRQSSIKSQKVATQAMRDGNFAGLPALKDPLNNNAVFPSNIIPGNRISSVTRRLGELYPSPNTAGTAAAGTGTNLVEDVPLREQVKRYSARVDHSISSRDQLSASLMVAYLGPNPSVGSTSGFGGYKETGDHNTNTALSWIRSISPNTTNELRLGYMHLRVYRTPQNVDFDAASVIPGLGPQGINGAPKITITNIVSMSESGSNDLEQNFQLLNTISRVKGSHNIKAGFQYVHGDHYNFSSRSPQRGAYNFTGKYSGYAFADFVLGYPLTTQRPTPSVLAVRYRQHRLAGFFQDDWKVTSNLTLNFGIRYDFQPLQPEYNGMASMFIPSQKGIAVFGNSFPKTSIQRLVTDYGIRLSKDMGLPSDLMSYLGQDTNNFAPRVGFAYRLTPSMVLRGGSGIYYVGWNLNSTQNASTSLPFVSSETFEQPTGTVPGITMSNPFPGSGTLAANPATALIAAPATPYNMQWNLTLEKQVLGDVGLRLGYYGQRNIKTQDNADLNAVGYAPGNVQLRRPYQPYSGITVTNMPMYQSSAHQLQAGIQKRYSKGLLLSAEYQFIRAIGTESYLDPTNYNDSRGNLSDIRTHVLMLSYVYDLPFGKNKLLFPNLGGWKQALAGGWQLSGITALMSGQPLTVTYSTSVQGWGNGRANVLQGAPLYPQDRTLTQYFNTAAFVLPAPYTYGNSANNMLWGPARQSWDASLAKNMAIRERVNLQIRMDAFSVFNHPVPGDPDTNISSNTAGRISSVGGDRTVQLGAKFTF